MTAYVIAEVAVKDRERYAAESVPKVSKAYEENGWQDAGADG